jgi:hypothetical protein
MSQSQIVDDDMLDLLHSLNEEELRSFARTIPSDSSSKRTLYACHYEIYCRTKAEIDLDAAIDAGESLLWETVEILPGDASFAEEIGRLLQQRFELMLDFQDLEGAIHWLGEANKVTPSDSQRFMLQLETITALSDNLSHIPRSASYEDLPLDILPKAILTDDRGASH